MKTKQFFFIYYILLVAMVVFRITTVFNTTDQTTGFFFNGRPTFNIIVSLLVLVFFASFSFSIKRFPMKMPIVNLPLSLSSFLVGVSMIVRSFSIYTGASLATPINICKILLNLITAVFFIVYSTKLFMRNHIKRILYVVPLFYFLASLVYSYITTSKMSLISENSFLVLSSATLSMFLLYFSKLANSIGTESNTNRFILFFGIISSVLCEAFAIPQLYAILDGTQKVLHNDISVLLVYLTMGFFVLCFTSTFYANKNLYKKHHKSDGSGRILPTTLDFSPEAANPLKPRVDNPTAGNETAENGESDSDEVTAANEEPVIQEISDGTQDL